MENTKKRILIFVPEFPVLSETFIEREITKLAEFEDIDVTIVSLKKGTGAKSENINDKVQYIKLSIGSTINGIVLILKNIKLFVELFKIALCNKNRCPSASLYLLLKSYAYTSVFMKYSPDTIHAHFLSEPSTLVYFISRISKVSFSISAHARDVFGNNSNKELNAELVVEKAKYAQFIVICNYKAFIKCKELAGEEYKDKIILHYHGIDPAIFDRIDTSGMENISKPFIFSVGRLEEKKGYTYLISAVKILKERGISFVLKIAGPGKLYEQLNKQISEQGLSDYVQILGEGKGVINSEILKHMSKAMIFVLPSIETADNDSEGIPNTLIEAGFLKKAILTTDTGSISELIVQNVNGILAVQKSDYALADGLEKLIFNENLRSSIGQAIYDTVKEKFDLNKNIIGLKELLLK